MIPIAREQAIESLVQFLPRPSRWKLNLLRWNASNVVAASKSKISLPFSVDKTLLLRAS